MAVHIDEARGNGEAGGVYQLGGLSAVEGAYLDDPTLADAQVASVGWTPGSIYNQTITDYEIVGQETSLIEV
jgi:hypothetical protein